MTIARTLAGSLFVAMLVAPVAHAQRRPSRNRPDVRSRVDTTLAFDRSGTLTISAGAGDIIVTGTSGTQAHVIATSEDGDLRVDASNTRLTLDVSGSRSGDDARFEVTVPFGVRVVAKSQGGDITIRGTRGEVEAHSQSGDVHVDEVAGHLDARSLSGDITVSSVAGDADVTSTAGDVKLSDVRGNIEVGTVSGDVQLRGITARTVRAKTTSGDVIFDGSIDPAGRYDLATHSGDVLLHVQREASAQLTVSTWNGTIDSEFPITLKPGEHGIGASNAKRFTFEIGGGAARISAETFSGDITVSSNGRGATDRRP